MDADRFDALSRALTTIGSRRTTLGALLGALFASALPASLLDPLTAAGKGKGKRQRHATKKDRHPRRGAGTNGRHEHLGQDRHQPHSRDVSDEKTPRRTEAAQLESVAVRVSDVGAGSHCLPSLALGCRSTSMFEHARGLAPW